MDERRLQERFRVRLPVELDSATGTIRDISVSGIYFDTGRAFRQGERIKFSFVFEHVYPSGALHVRCEGQVVRVESVDDHVGVAARILSYHIRRTADRLRGKRLDQGKRTGERRGRMLSEPDMGNGIPSTGQQP